MTFGRFQPPTTGHEANFNSVRRTAGTDDYRIYIRPSGTEPLMRVLVEAKNQKKVNYLSNEITNKLSLEIKKIMN